jgi:hypothetical protein
VHFGTGPSIISRCLSSPTILFIPLASLNAVELVLMFTSNLESGGIFESQETGFPIACDDGTMKKSSALYQWSISVNNAAKKLGFPIDTANTTKQSLKDFGFVDVVEKRFMWPMNRWPKEKKYKILGRWTQENFVSGIEAMCMALLTRGLGWSAEEVTTVTDQVKKDMMNTSIHAYWNVYVVYGRKP